MDRKLQMNL